MKKLLAIALISGVLLCAAGCTGNEAKESSSEAGTSSAETTVSSDEASADSSTESTVVSDVNEGDFKSGSYEGNSAYSEGEFSMIWNYIVNLCEDGTFTITDNAGEEKGAGTYALTENCYTMTYSDGRSCTFVVQKDGTLKVLSDLPYGKASISPDMVGGITLTYSGDVSDKTESEENTSSDNSSTDATAYSIAAGSYTASYTKESPMAGTVVYNYSATLGEDGTFSYSVSFDMGGEMYDGSTASGTYTVDGNKFIFTDESGNATEGALTADNTLVISLMASAMAKDPYEVTFTAGASDDAPTGYALTAGNYKASYTKESPMAGTVVYNYTAEIGADTFSYSVSFDMGGEMYDGSTASGTYTVDGDKFIFTDSEGNAIEGVLTADDTLVISLMASAMAKEPYEVTFVIAE